MRASARARRNCAGTLSSPASVSIARESFLLSTNSIARARRTLSSGAPSSEARSRSPAARLQSLWRRCRSALRKRISASAFSAKRSVSSAMRTSRSSWPLAPTIKMTETIGRRSSRLETDGRRIGTSARVALLADDVAEARTAVHAGVIREGTGVRNRVDQHAVPVDIDVGGGDVRPG